MKISELKKLIKEIILKEREFTSDDWDDSLGTNPYISGTSIRKHNVTSDSDNQVDIIESWLKKLKIKPFEKYIDDNIVYYRLNGGKGKLKSCDCTSHIRIYLDSNRAAIYYPEYVSGNTITGQSLELDGDFTSADSFEDFKLIMDKIAKRAYLIFGKWPFNN